MKNERSFATVCRMAIRTEISLESANRFWAKVVKADGCWMWTGGKNEKGYGVFGIGKSTDKASRISWRLTVGPIPKGMFVLHKCDNPGCVNPDHLFLGSNQDNVDDMISKNRNSPPPNMGGWNAKPFPEDKIDLLGTMPDTVLGKMVGLSKYSVARRRHKSEIPPFPSPSLFKKGDPHPRWSRKKGGK